MNLSNWTRWLKKTFGNRHNRKAGPVGRGPRRFMPRLESLEERLTPAVHIWTGPQIGGLWSNAANWSGGAPTTGEQGGTIVRFAGSAVSTDDISALVLDRVEFASDGDNIQGAGGVTLGISGNVLSTNILNTDGANQFSLPLVLTGATIGTNITPGSGFLVFDNTVTGPSNIFVQATGSGTVEVGPTGSLQNTGGITIQNGELLMNRAAADNMGIAGGPVVIGDGVGAAGSALLSFGDGTFLGNDLQMATTTAVTVNQDGQIAFPDNFHEQIGALTMNGGLITLTGKSTSAIRPTPPAEPQLDLFGDVNATGGAMIVGATQNPVLGVLGLMGNRTFTVTGISPADLTVTATIENVVGPGALNKAGNGTMVVNAANIFTGGTTITAGTLQVDNGVVMTPQPLNIGAVSLNGGTLAGVGYVGTTTATANGGTVAPGDNGVGTLHVGVFTLPPTEPGILANSTWNPQVTYKVDLNGTGAGQFDQLQVSGSANIGGANLVVSPTLAEPINVPVPIILSQSSVSSNFAQAPFVFGGGQKFSPAVANIVSILPRATIQRIQANTATTVTTSASSSSFGQQITFTATVTPEANTTGTPVGNMVFTIDGADQAPVNTVNGVAVFSTGSLSVAGSPHNITARFNDTDGLFLTSIGTLVGGQTVTVGNLPIGSAVISHGSFATFSLGTLIPSPVGTEVFSSSLLDPLLALQTTYGLNTRDYVSAFNARGQNEKYLYSSNGSNAANGGAYVLMPSGNLYAFVANPASPFSLALTLAGAPVATLPVSVYDNPALLTATTGAPLATLSFNPLYDLANRFGLGGAVLSVPAAYSKAGQKYLMSGNGSNAAGGGVYLLMPNDTLLAFGGTVAGSVAASTLVADLTPYGDVYNNPTLLTNASDPTTVGIVANINPASGGTLTLTPAVGFDRSVQVTVNASDANPAHSISQTFTLTVNDTAPKVPVVNLAPVTHNAVVPKVALGATDAENDPLTYSLSVVGSSPLYDLKVQYGLTTPDIDVTSGGQTVKYFNSSNGSNAGPAGGGVYVLMPTGNLYAFNTTLAMTLTGPVLANLSSFGVYANTALLYGASVPAVPTVAANQGSPLFNIKEKFGLNSPDVGFNQAKQMEKYFNSSNGSNSSVAGGGVYVLMPTDKLYAFNTNLATTLLAAPVADLSPFGVYANTAQLFLAQPTVIGDPLFKVKEQFGLTTMDVDVTSGGQTVKYFNSGNGSNAGAAGGGVYVLMPTGLLYAFNTTLATTLTGAPVADLSSFGAYANTAKLYASTGQVPAINATVDAAGNIAIVPSTSFLGSARITAIVSDGVERTTRSFLFTVNDGVPALPNISPASVSSALGSTSIALNAKDSSGNTNDLSFFATVAAYSPVYDIKLQYGLTTRDVDVTSGGTTVKYFNSSNGSNSGPAGGGVYVLMPSGLLYAFDTTLATTLTDAPIADLSPYGVYANTALLYNATLPAAPSITTGFTNVATGGTLTLSWPAGFTGTFRTTAFVSDGALQTQQSFLVTVN